MALGVKSHCVARSVGQVSHVRPDLQQVTLPEVCHGLNTVNIYLELVKELSFFKGYSKISTVNNDRNTIIHLKIKKYWERGISKKKKQLLKMIDIQCTYNVNK